MHLRARPAHSLSTPCHRSSVPPRLPTLRRAPPLLWRPAPNVCLRSFSDGAPGPADSPPARDKGAEEPKGAKKIVVKEKSDDVTRTFVITEGDLQSPLRYTEERMEKKKHTGGLQERLQGWFQGFFFPLGYPKTVSADYWPFHRWWLLSNLANSANYVLSMQCLLTAVGLPMLGSAPLSAGISWVLKDGLGSVLSMFVAGKFALRFDLDPKNSRWRADLLHNVGVALEILTPLVPAYFLPLASLANTAKGIAGLISGATRASFNRGFARSDNLGEVTAKAQGQGIAAYLLGMGLGIAISFVAPTHQLGYTFAAYLALAAVHLGASYQSLCSVALTSLNLQRAFLLVEQYVAASAAQAMMARIATPDEVRLKERFVRAASPWSPHLVLGAPVEHSFASPAELLACLRLFAPKAYLLTLSPRGDGRLHILLKKEATQRDVLEALFHALVVVQQHPAPAARTAEHVRAALPLVAERFSIFFAQLATSQWKDSDLIVHATRTNRLHVNE